MIDAIIFDKDGTLFDFHATWGGWAQRVLDEVAGDDAARRAAAAEAMGFDAGRGFHPSSVVIAHTAVEIAAALAEATGFAARDLEAMANRLASSTPPVVVTRLAETLHLLAGRHILGLVTNDGEAQARAHLGACGIAEHFAFVAGYDSGHGAKPDPGPLLAFSRATGTRPERTLMVGDSRHDLAAGRAAGMTTVGVLTGVAGASDLADLADVTLQDISLLPGWIASRSRG
jgi:phosphoglycolate phosphatase